MGQRYNRIIVLPNFSVPGRRFFSESSTLFAIPMRKNLSLQE